MEPNTNRSLLSSEITELPTQSFDLFGVNYTKAVVTESVEIAFTGLIEENFEFGFKQTKLKTSFNETELDNVTIFPLEGNKFVTTNTGIPGLNASEAITENLTVSGFNNTECVSEIIEISGLDYLYFGILFVMMMLICIGNGLIFTAFWRSAKLKTITNFYIIQLAIADFGLGLILPFHMAIFFQREIVTENVMACVLRYASFTFFAAASMCGLVGLTYDRYFAVNDPLQYHCATSVKRYVVSALLIWSIPLVLGIILPLLWHNDMSAECPICDYAVVVPRDYIRFVLIPYFLLVTTMLVGLYSQIFRIAKNQIKGIDLLKTQTSTKEGETSNKHSKAENNLRKQMKIVKAGFIVFATFYICWLPFFIAVAIQMYSGDYTNKILNMIRLFATFLATINSFVNPIIYAFRLPAFRAELGKMFCKKKQLKKTYSSTVSAISSKSQ